MAVFNSRSTLMPKIEAEHLFEEQYMCIAHKLHPRIQQQLSLENYLQEKHAAIKSSTGHIAVDQKLKELGLNRNIMLEVPHFSVLQDVVTHSELLVTLPSRAARVYEKNSDINIFELPLQLKPFCVSVHWYNHSDDLEARKWFIKTLKHIFQLL